MLQLAALVLATALAEPNPARTSDVMARTTGNDPESMRAIGDQIFGHIEAAQILRLSVYRIGSHRIAGLILSGVKFHRPLDRVAFTQEVLRLVATCFAASKIEEVDVRTIVPVTVGRGVLVSGDNAAPSNRDVFTLTARREESQDALRKRIAASDGVFWESWFLVRPHGR